MHWFAIVGGNGYVFHRPVKNVLAVQSDVSLCLMCPRVSYLLLWLGFFIADMRSLNCGGLLPHWLFLRCIVLTRLHNYKFMFFTMGSGNNHRQIMGIIAFLTT